MITQNKGPIIIGQVFLETPHVGGEHKDEIRRDVYTIRKDRAGAYFVNYTFNIYSDKKAKVEGMELKELREFQPAEAKQEEKRAFDEAKRMTEAEHEARLKGDRFVSQKTLTDLTAYLKQFLDQLQEH